MDPCKNLEGSWGVIGGAAIGDITPAEASLEGHVLVGTVPLLALFEGQVVGEQGQQHDLLTVPPLPPCIRGKG